MARDMDATFQNTVPRLREAIVRHARYSLGLEPDDLDREDVYRAVSLAVREFLVDGMLATEKRYAAHDAKRLYYLSMEFLVGRSLGNNLLNLGLFEACRQAVGELGVDLEEVRECERDAALGNGGLGRLAACFLDSLATLNMPGYGYGINYQYGLFKQRIDRGYQREQPDNWMSSSNPWLIERNNESIVVPVYGWVEEQRDALGLPRRVWLGQRIVIGVPYDMPIVGYGGKTVNFLRLFSARSSEDFDMQIFNQGEYLRAVQQKIASETVSKVLYPSDSVEQGRELRLIQEYFLVACAVRDLVKRFDASHEKIEEFPEKVAVHLNDTHPTLAIAELMRILIDERNVVWENAWKIAQDTFAFTNHTLMPEALETWPTELLHRVVPRHLEIIREIDSRFCDHLKDVWPDDPARRRHVSIIDTVGEERVRMAHLSIVGSHSTNGVADLHSELLKSDVVPDFNALWPERFTSVTNGVTQRRWLQKANPPLADLLDRTIGPEWVTDLSRLRDLESRLDDASFPNEFAAAKHTNKETLAATVSETTGITVDPYTLFDVHVKRIHEYKRQLLNVLRIIYEYLELIEDGVEPATSRTYLFAGKAAPGYWAAKQIIKLINNVADVINRDAKATGLMRVAFLPDYRVSLAERIIPAADVSEQISTAGTEASGTGNMKLAMNGALTVGTLDGANIEILAEVGEENMYIFGHTADEVGDIRGRRAYDPRGLYDADEKIRRAVDALASDLFCPREPGLFEWVFNALLSPDDPYLHLADLPSYVDVQRTIGAEYNDQDTWRRKALLNVARIERFSSDRAIAEYAGKIWQLESYPPGPDEPEAGDGESELGFCRGADSTEGGANGGVSASTTTAGRNRG